MRSALAIGLVAATFTLAGCRAATEMRVEVTTDVGCSDYTGTTIAVGSLGKIDPSRPASESTVCGSDGTVGTVVLTPTGAEDAEVSFELSTAVNIDPSSCKEGNKSCIVARRALKYLPNETLVVKVPMRVFCEGVVCEPDSTCSEGQCVSAKIGDPKSCLAPNGCGESALSSSGAGGNGGGGNGGGGGAGASGGGGSAPTGDVLDLALGMNHGCALLKDKSVRCWGQGSDLGIASDHKNETKPITIGLTGIASINSTAGSESTLGIDTRGRVLIWGNQNFNGQIPGQPSTAGVTPTMVPLPDIVDRAIIGPTVVGALRSDGKKLFFWGQINMNGVLAVQTIDFGAPVVDELKVGDKMILLRHRDHSIETFGGSDYLGSGANETSLVPAKINTPSQDFVEVAFDFEDVIAQHANGKHVVWGVNDQHQLALGGNQAPVSMPQEGLASLDGVTDIAIGGRHACGLKAGKVLCWGDNERGTVNPSQVGGNTGTPTAIAGIPSSTQNPAIKVWSGYLTSCAMLKDQTIYCWGNNEFGQVGVGSPDMTVKPTQIKFD